jgi:hypothetical protein
MVSPFLKTDHSCWRRHANAFRKRQAANQKRTCHGIFQVGERDIVVQASSLPPESRLEACTTTLRQPENCAIRLIGRGTDGHRDRNRHGQRLPPAAANEKEGHHRNQVGSEERKPMCAREKGEGQIPHGPHRPHRITPVWDCSAKSACATGEIQFRVNLGKL